MSFVSRASVLAAALSFAMPASAAPADLRERVDAYLASAFPADGPGVSVIVTDDGETLYAGGRGLADLEAASLITPQTVFRLGSITKQFTSAVILQLVQEGRLSLDDRVSRFFPDYPRPGADATVAQLLNHTSGIQSYTGIPGWMVEANTNRAYTTAEMIALFRDLPSPSSPGERHDYNNSGYVLLGAIIEQVTGTSWHEAVEQRIARPLGLATIRYGVGESDMPSMARGYTAGPDGVAPANPIHMSVPHAAGALVGTVEDLARWARALHHGQVVDAGSYARMTAPTRMPDDSVVPYGFGLSNAELRGRRGIGHGGGIFGFSTDSLYLPEEDLFVAVFANSDEPAASPGIVLRRIAALALDDPYPEFARAQADLDALAPWFGVYDLAGNSGSRRFYARDGRLYTRRSGGAELEVFAAGEDRFFYGPESLTWFSLERDETGRPVMAMHQNGEQSAERSARTGPIPPEAPAAEVSRDTLETYVGRYVAPMAPVVVAWGEDDQLTVQLGGQRPLALRPTSATEFEVVGVEARVVFQSEGGGVSGLVIHQGGREIAATRGESPPAS
ncbi:MAG TPA: serine hydrolase domain-containing protein [Allosphingosinicella sp.]|nr:serine hydrolase domain-containing protein [Allosphingosinicella sp.]